MSVMGGDVFDAECILKRPKKGKVEYLVKRRGRPCKEQEKEILLHKHGKRPRGRPRKIVELVPTTTESSSSISSPDDDNISAEKVKLSSRMCETHPVMQKKAQTVVTREEPVKKKRGRKTLPPELRARKLLKNPSKTLPRQPKPDIKKPLLPDSFTGIRRSSRALVGVQSGQSSSSSGQGQGALQHPLPQRAICSVLNELFKRSPPHCAALSPTQLAEETVIFYCSIALVYSPPADLLVFKAYVIFT
ncbi:hypothetical protein SKAU_G00125550 [Synaphobranchus kaupii]|uniref:Uncharacterized protein n=1 Tax=Synaphobranchus kaupii TaxID=118154 RepID=A0A9Q1J1V5_SYNKA|nr:hypothetical protein SKAU_G00125550 [Synaphobranchus kaupii]